MLTRAVLIVVSITALGMVVRDLSRHSGPGRGTPHAPAVHAAPGGVHGCPSSGPAGTVAWTFHGIGAIAGPPAIDDDGAAYFGTAAGWLFSVGCDGRLRWVIVVAATFPELGAHQQFSEPLVLGADATLHVVSALAEQYMPVFAVGTDGRWKRPPLWSFGDQYFVSHFVGSLALGEGGRAYFSDGKPSDAFRAFPENRWSGLIAVDREGYIPRGFPLVARSSAADPVMVGRDRLLFVSDGLSTPTPRLPATFQQPPTPIAPPPTPSPTPTPTPTAIFSQTPSVRPWWTATPTPTWTPRPAAARVMLPLALRLWHPVQPTHFIDDDAMLHILEDGRISSRRLPLGKMRATALVATDRMAVLEVVERPPRLLAVSLDGPGGVPLGVPLWEHRLNAEIVGVPVLGARDPATGWRELVYADTRGLMVSLQVPEDPVSSGFPIFNWARGLPAPITAAPALGDDGLVYVGAGSTIFALRRADGGDGWQCDLAADLGKVTGAITLGPSGLLHVGTDKGHLLAIHTGAGGLDPAAAWPALRHDRRNTGRGE
jgi:outer membrane protein assembly factor BamB